MPGFPENVMIIDDDQTLLDLEEASLKRAGNICVRKCGNYEQAVEVLSIFTPDLILLDLRMPGRNGTDVLRALKTMENATDIPVIFVTGESRIEMQEDYRKLGVLGVIYKPFKPSDFIMSVQKLWQTHRFSNDP